MRRAPARLRLALAAAALAVVACAGGRAHARGDRRTDHLDGTTEEVEGWLAVEDGKWVRAREVGEKLVRDRPEAWAGHYVLGVAMHYGEGDLARSVFHLERAARLFERRHGPKPEGAAPWRWHEAALRELSFSLNEIDKPREELLVLDRYDQAYTPKRLAQRVWPLMKLERYDDARAQARLAVASGRPEQEMIARSDLCAAECEAGDREKAYQACVAALEPFHSRTIGGQVEHSNASEAALAVYKFDEAERFLAESTRRASVDAWGNPYQKLALLYLAEGRIPESIAALKGGQELRMRRPAWLDQHGQARLDWTVAALLLVAGETDRALLIAERAEARPDRQGVHSGTEAQATSAAAVLVAAARREAAARASEDAVTSGFFAGLKLRARALAQRFAAWQETRRAAVLFSDQKMLVRTMRPYYVGGSDLSEWMVPEVVGIVGAGVALRALAAARAADTFGAAPGYYEALVAEAELLRGRDEAALAAAERALSGSGGLPHAEVLLLGRAAAVGAEAARRLGRREQATTLYATALTKDPGVLRRLDLRLPVRVEHDGSALGREAADLVASSPRFLVERGGRGHVVHLAGASDVAEACLLGPSREVLECATASGTAKLSPRDGARRLVAELHRAAFAYKADLSQADLTSLDGSPTAARADRQVRTLLDTLAPTGP